MQTVITEIMFYGKKFESDDFFTNASLFTPLWPCVSTALHNWRQSYKLLPLLSFSKLELDF